MQLTLEELLKGNKTRIKENDFFSTEAYCMPFIERMRAYTDDFIFSAIPPQQITINRDGTENTVYNKVLIEAILPSEDPLYSETIGFTYGLDTRKPIAKFFRCIKNNNYGGFLIDSDQYIISQDLEPERTINYLPVEKLMSLEFTTRNWISKIKNIMLNGSNDNINFKLGQWIRFAINFSIGQEFGKIKIATNDIISGYKSLWEDDKSDFFTSFGIDVDYLKIYDAFSTVIYNSKDIITFIDKSRLMKDILSL